MHRSDVAAVRDLVRNPGLYPGGIPGRVEAPVDVFECVQCDKVVDLGDELLICVACSSVSCPSTRWMAPA